jgi:hypothetical protein
VDDSVLQRGCLDQLLSRLRVSGPTASGPSEDAVHRAFDRSRPHPDVVCRRLAVMKSRPCHGVAASYPETRLAHRERAGTVNFRSLMVMLCAR